MTQADSSTTARTDTPETKFYLPAVDLSPLLNTAGSALESRLAGHGVVPIPITYNQ